MQTAVAALSQVILMEGPSDFGEVSGASAKSKGEAEWFACEFAGGGDLPTELTAAAASLSAQSFAAALT